MAMTMIASAFTKSEMHRNEENLVRQHTVKAMCKIESIQRKVVGNAHWKRVLFTNNVTFRLGDKTMSSTTTTKKMCAIGEVVHCTYDSRHGHEEVQLVDIGEDDEGSARSDDMYFASCSVLLIMMILSPMVTLVMYDAYMNRLTNMKLLATRCERVDDEKKNSIDNNEKNKFI